MPKVLISDNLSAQAVDILRALPRVDGNPHVIVGRREAAHLVNLQKPWRRIRKLAGLDDAPCQIAVFADPDCPFCKRRKSAAEATAIVQFVDDNGAVLPVDGGFLSA